ncbi:MAG: ATP-binding protein [Methylococcus sp.]
MLEEGPKALFALAQPNFGELAGGDVTGHADDADDLAYQSLDVTGRWLDANQRMAELLGFGSPTEMLGKDFGDYWQDAARAAFPGKFEEFKRTHTVDGELLLRRVDGRPISVLIAGKIERDAKGRFIRTHCILTDITERRALEDRISDLNATLEEKVVQLAAANAAKSQFMGHMSHELRTPMNAILGFAQLLEYLVPEPDHRDLVRMIRESGDHLLRIIDDILDLAKIEAGQLRINTQAFSLPSVLERVDHMLRIQANAKGLEFRVEPPPTPIGALLGDPGRLQQILVNLVGNALKFTEQGQVSLIVAPAAAAAPARLRLRFEVRDTGIGIPPEVLETLFQPFSQGDASLTRRFGGTGLGLVISQRLVEGMGGEMGVQSVVGQGSTFWFEIPFQRVEADPADEANAAEPAAEQRPLAGLRVLAVDDNPINLRMIGRVLEQQGANVAQARDGQAALHVLRSRPGDFDVVLMDVQMPVMNGLEATRAIRGDVALATLPVIALTAGVLPEERAAALDAGMNDFLAKPLNLSQLLAALKPYLSRAGQ